MRKKKTELIKPVKVDDKLEVYIEAVGKKGDGIAKIEGFTIFVPNSIVNSMPKVKIVKVFNTFAIAELID